MSLAGEVITKALEVGVGTILANAVAQRQSDGSSSSSKDQTFKQKPTDSSSTTDVSKIISQLLQLGTASTSIISEAPEGNRRWIKLAICICIDLVGSGSLAVPILGDFLDLATAPASAAMLQALFGNSWITTGGLIEEILPGTDTIPTATLAWLAEQSGYLNATKKNTE